MNNQGIDKIPILKTLDIFSFLSLMELELIAERTRLMEFKKEEIVYREGDPADAFYIVVSGRLRIVKERDMLEEEVVLDYLHKGDTFGEISLLTNQPHSVTVKAHNDSLVLKLSKEDFDSIINRMPTIALPLSRILSRRLRQKYQNASSPVTESRIVSVYSAAKGVGSTVFAMNLSLHLYKETQAGVILLDMSQTGAEVSGMLKFPRRRPLVDFEHLGFVGDETIKHEIIEHPSGFKILNVGHTLEDDSDARIIAPLLSYLTEHFSYVVIDLPDLLDNSVFKALTQSDLIYIVCNTKDDNLLKTDALIKRLIDSPGGFKDKIRVVLNCVDRYEDINRIKQKGILEYKISHCLPIVGNLLSLQEAQVSYYLAGRNSSYYNVVRYIAREASEMLVGLALGSGAALGFAHIGVLRVLEQENIPVDIVSGASMGALIAAFWVSGRSSKELEEIAKSFRNKFRTLRLLDVEYPLMGFIKGRTVERFINSILKDMTFENAAKPVRIVSSNPTTRQEIVFETGRLADAVRASISIPGIFHPVVRNGELQVDGGTISPVPVDTLRKAGAKKIIAVNVFPSTEDILKYAQDSRMREQEKIDSMQEEGFFVRWAWILKAAILRRMRYNVFDVIMRSMQSMEYRIAEINCRNADIVIRPTIAGSSWMEFFRADKFIKRGEEETIKMLPQIKHLVAKR